MPAEVPRNEKDYDTYTMKNNESLWDVAYSHVLPPHSDESVNRCFNNIVENNTKSNFDERFLKIPFPCDPKDAAELVDMAANRLYGEFRQSDSAYHAASKLSEELVKRIGTLDTSSRDYNYLISKLHDQIEKDPYYQGVRIGAEHWNSKTHTWDNVQLVDNNPDNPPVRIVQPDNTIRGIADDRMQQLRSAGHRIDSNKYIEEFMVINGLRHDYDLTVGTPVVLPY